MSEKSPSWKFATFRVPFELHKEFKTLTSQNDESMTTIIEKEMRRYVDEKKKTVVY